MNTQEKIDAYLNANFITKSTRRCNMHNNKKYDYLMAYVDRLKLLRNNFGANKANNEIYTIAHRGKIATEIWRIQEKLKELAEKQKKTLPKKYLN